MEVAPVEIVEGECREQRGTDSQVTDGGYKAGNKDTVAVEPEPEVPA
jgi:hypothetical protein